MVNDKVIKNFMDEYICIDPKKSYKIEDLIGLIIGLDVEFDLDEFYGYLTKKDYYFKVEKYEIYGIYPIDEYDGEGSSNNEDNSNFKKIFGRHCVVTGCKIHAVFNFLEKNPRYCLRHKIDEMINVREKRRCIEEGCTSLCPLFNFPDEKNGIRCGIHKLSNMIDVVHSQCDKDGCTTRPCFNFPGEKNGTMCGIHKLGGMINVIGSQCKKEGCIIQPCFNLPGERVGIFCETHKLSGMINVVGKKCISCNNVTLNSANKYDDYCRRCYINIYPDNTISRRFKTKERMVVDFIRENYSGEIFFDKKVNGECSSNRRPDVRIDRGVFNLIIEVDENQHRNYDPTCENKRTMQLFQDLGNRPLVLIRINPDHYYDKNGEKIDSCFDYKVLEMPLKNKEEFNKRMIVLKEKIDYYMNFNDIPEKEIDTDTVLFFDGY
jgi:EsV-1-7 cysteine-rich motif